MGFYVIKGLVSLLAVLLLLGHMRAVKREPTITLGRWLRYLALLFFAVLLTGTSVDQINNHSDINWYNVGGMVGACVLVVAVTVSIGEKK